MPETAQQNFRKPEVRKELARTAGEKPSEKSTLGYLDTTLRILGPIYFRRSERSHDQVPKRESVDQSCITIRGRSSLRSERNQVSNALSADGVRRKNDANNRRGRISKEMMASRRRCHRDLLARTPVDELKCGSIHASFFALMK